MTILTTEMIAAFEAALTRNGGSVRAAAAEIGVSRTTGRRWVKHVSVPTRKHAEFGHRYVHDVTKKDAAQPFLIAPRALKKPPEEFVFPDIRCNSKRYVVTSAQNCTPVFKPFLEALKVYCAENNAQLVVAATKYRNPTSIHENEKSSDWWADEVVPYLTNQRQKLNENLVVMADVNVSPTSQNPLSGLENITGACSAIVGHVQIAFKSVATMQSKMPKTLMSTGSVTVSNFSKSKAGAVGAHNFALGATLVEIVDDKRFHTRQLNALRDGSFVDLTREYTSTGSRDAGPAEALVMGDTHVEFIEDSTLDALFRNKNSIVNVLRPKNLVFHDFFDGYSISHWHDHDPFLQYGKSLAGTDNLEAAITRAFKVIDDVVPDFCDLTFVASNHHEHIGRWLREHARVSPVNALFHAKTTLALLEGTTIGKHGKVSTPDPLAMWGKKLLKCAPRARFLKRDESFDICGIQNSFHGDKGSGGARGNAKMFSRIAEKTNIGHGHSPNITGGCYQAGVSSMDLEYASGSPSSWMNTHIVIYPNGKRSLITILTGTDEWRLEPKKSKPIKLKPVVGTMHPLNIFYTSVHVR